MSAMLTPVEHFTLLASGGTIGHNDEPYYVEAPAAWVSLWVASFNNFKDARKFAVNYTRGMSKINGQLNDRCVKIYENGGKLIETIISGLPESEYNAIKERQAKESMEQGTEIKSVVSFGWKK
ncbi:MAG: hypothetical protein FWH44_03760 [Methanomassiliicoccaceae archaeon]|nr:hypothetical protein [Methanomassiliicoccaceae archaeon]